MQDKDTKITVHSLGEVELRYVSAADADDFAKLLDEDSSDKEFVVNLLHHQLVSPLTELDVLAGLPDAEIQQLARAFLEFEETYGESFEDTGEFYGDFRRAANAEQMRQMESLRRIVESFASVQQTIASITDQYTSSIHAIIHSSTKLEQTIRSLAFLTIQPPIFDLGISGSFGNLLENIENTSRMFSSTIQAIVDSSARWTQQIQLISDPFSGFWEALQRQYGITAKQAAKVLREYNWFITPSLPPRFVHEIVEIGARPGRRSKAINDLFISHFEANNWRNLDALVSGWKANPLLGKRHRILRDCIRTLKVCKGNTYSVNAVLPTVIVQIDAALLDFMDEKKIPRGTYGERVPKIRDKRPKVLDVSLDELAADIFLGVLFRKLLRGDGVKTPFDFNRHKIIHGETVRYGRKDNLVRAFMVLDLLAHWSIADAAIDNG